MESYPSNRQAPDAQSIVTTSRLVGGPSSGSREIPDYRIPTGLPIVTTAIPRDFSQRREKPCKMGSSCQITLALNSAHTHPSFLLRAAGPSWKGLLGRPAFAGIGAACWLGRGWVSLGLDRGDSENSPGWKSSPRHIQTKTPQRFPSGVLCPWNWLTFSNGSPTTSSMISCAIAIPGLSIKAFGPRLIISSVKVPLNPGWTVGAVKCTKRPQPRDCSYLQFERLSKL